MSLSINFNNYSIMERRKVLGILLTGSALSNVWATEPDSSRIDKKELLKSLRLANDYFVKKVAGYRKIHYYQS